MTKDTQASEIDEIERCSVCLQVVAWCLVLSVYSDSSTEHSSGSPDSALI